MSDLNGQVTVITGAASGLGRALAEIAARRGMQLVLADVDEAGLEESAARANAVEHLIVPTDVSRPEALDALADATYAKFGRVDLLFNNAGIAVSGPVWTAPIEEWRWVMDINLMGVVHGIQAFTPRMLEAGRAARIVNTSSAAGLLSPAASGIYAASKHAVLALSECMYHELELMKAPVRVSVLCPGFFKTQISRSARLRPNTVPRNQHPITQMTDQVAIAMVEQAPMSADEVAAKCFAEIDNDAFYIFTHPEVQAGFGAHMQHVLGGKAPFNPMPSDPTQ